MSIYEKVKDFVAKRKVEQLTAELAKQTAVTDYLAMMSNIEIPEREVTDDVV